MAAKRSPLRESWCVGKRPGDYYKTQNKCPGHGKHGFRRRKSGCLQNETRQLTHRQDHKGNRDKQRRDYQRRADKNSLS